MSNDLEIRGFEWISKIYKMGTGQTHIFKFLEGCTFLRVILLLIIHLSNQLASTETRSISWD